MINSLQLQLEEFVPGDICLVEFPIVAHGLDAEDLSTFAYHLYPGELFLLLSILEIPENNILEVEIMYKNLKLWFNIHKSDSNIVDVRRAELYDIPFMTLLEDEPGSNSSSLVDSIPPYKDTKGCFSHFLTFGFSDDI